MQKVRAMKDVVLGLALVLCELGPAVCVARAQKPSDVVVPARYSEAPAAADWSLERPVQTGASEETNRDVELVRQLARHRGGQPAALAQIIQLSSQFQSAVAAEILDELAAAHLRAGNLNLAAEARTVLAERFPGEPLAHRSLLWLVRLYASSEMAHAQRGESEGTAALKQQLAPRVAEALRSAPETIGDERTPETSASPTQVDQRSIFALHLATQAMSRHAALADDPALAFQRAVAARRAGQSKAAQAFLSPLKHRGAEDVWGQCARAEAWLAESKEEAAPKAVFPCALAEARPNLDGILDEPCWQREIPSLDAGDPTKADVRWAYDRDHLYVAVQCKKLAGGVYRDDHRPRPRDGDVDAHDHVRLLIDVDRDYASWFELAVDSRGWTTDRCWGDAAWNPPWYVARGESADGGAWTIEAAIPLAELSAAPCSSGAAWACAVTRRPPMKADPSAAAEAAPTPAAFGLLLFQ